MQTKERNQSLWEEASPSFVAYPSLDSEEVRADVVVVGGGMVGASTARALARAGVSVVLVERDVIGSGDSALSTGFLTRIPEASIENLVHTHGARSIKKMLDAAREAEKALVHMIEEAKLDCGFVRIESYIGSYATRSKELATKWSFFESVDPASFFVPTRVGPFAESIRVIQEGMCNAPALVRAMLSTERENPQLTVYEHTEAVSLDVASMVSVTTATGGRIIAKKAIIATGMPALLGEHVTRLVSHNITYVVAARYRGSHMLPQALFWDIESPYHYVRPFDDRTVVIGGSDGAAREAGPTSAGDAYEALESYARTRLRGDFTITHTWSGDIYETKDRLPYVFKDPRYDGKVFAYTGLSGNGLVYGYLVADILAALVRGKYHGMADMFSLARTGEHIEGEHAHDILHEMEDMYTRTLPAESIREGSAVCVEHGGKKVAVFRVGDTYYATQNNCTHAGGPLCKGKMEQGIVTCPWHGARFDVRDGAVKGPPATRPIATYPVRVVDGYIEIAFSQAGEKKEASSSHEAREHSYTKKQYNKQYIGLVVGFIIILLVLLYIVL